MPKRTIYWNNKRDKIERVTQSIAARKIYEKARAITATYNDEEFIVFKRNPMA